MPSLIWLYFSFKWDNVYKTLIMVFGTIITCNCLNYTLPTLAFGDKTYYKSIQILLLRMFLEKYSKFYYLYSNFKKGRRKMLEILWEGMMNHKILISHFTMKEAKTLRV